MIKVREKNGGWLLDIRLRLPDGTKYRERRRASATGKANALREAQARETFLVRNGGPEQKAPRAKKPHTLGAFLRWWLMRRRALPSHPDERGRIAHVIEAIGKQPLDYAALKDPIRAFVLETLPATPSKQGGALAPRSVGKIHQLLKQALKLAVAKDLLAKSPCEIERAELARVASNKRDKDPTWRATAVFARAEVEALISDERIPPERRVRYAIEFLSGSRTSECSALHWSDWEPDLEPLGRLTIARSFSTRVSDPETGRRGAEKPTKTGVVRLCPVHRTLAAILAAWRMTGWRATYGRAPRASDLIVPTKEFLHQKAGRALVAFHRDLRALGLARRRHYDSRRTFISLAVGDGARKDVLEWITHTPGDVFNAYETLPWPTLCEAVSALRIERREGRVLELPGGKAVARAAEPEVEATGVA